MRYQKNGIPVYLLCVVCAVVIASILTGSCASAQTPSPDLSFEVATVKPVDPSYHFDGTHHWAHVNPAGASYWYMTPIDLIAYAYEVEQFRIAGPEWAKHDNFDIEARFPEGADPKDNRRMLQALLKDRFKLVFHIEKRQLEVYVLIVGKQGERLRPSLPDPVSTEPDSPAKPGENKAGAEISQPKITKNPDGSTTFNLGKRGIQTLRFDQELWATHYEASKMTIEEMAGRLSTCVGRGFHKVVDETGITGTYQLAWDCPLGIPRPKTDGDASGMLPSDPEDGSSLTRSLDALGLKLERRKLLLDVYVIDHVERPSED